MNARTVSWTIALFFGCSVAFAALRRLTQHSSTGVTVAVQVSALVVILAVVLVVARRAGR